MHPVALSTATCIGVVVAAIAVTVRLHEDAARGPVRAPAAIAVTRVPLMALQVGSLTLELAAAGLRLGIGVDALIAEAGALLAGLDGVDTWQFERFPFDSRLPRLGRGRLEVPADESGTPSVSGWSRADGFEVPVWVGGLQVGRLVVNGSIACARAGELGSVRERAVAIADRLGSALAICQASG